MVEKEVFDVATTNENNVLQIKNYESVVAQAQKVLNNHPKPIITSDEDKAIAKDTRTRINKIVNSLKQRRISAVRDLTGLFEAQFKTLEKMFDDRSKEFGEAITEYENSKKVVTTSTQKIVATLTYYNDETTQKLIDFCKENNIELQIK